MPLVQMFGGMGVSVSFSLLKNNKYQKFFSIIIITSSGHVSEQCSNFCFSFPFPFLLLLLLLVSSFVHGFVLLLTNTRRWWTLDKHTRKKGEFNYLPTLTNTVDWMSAAAESELEFRAEGDDAWYSVLVAAQGERLTVKYVGFSDNLDEVFEASRFESFEELKEFEGRFRPVSVQLQDEECSKAVEGLPVCASHSFNGFDLRFYDAVIEHVITERHSRAKGEEECLCTFILVWQHGPGAGIMMEKKIENICLVQSKEKPDRNVALFLERAKEKIGKKCAKRSVSQIHPSEGWAEDINEIDRQDADLGGADNYLILIENLEKDLSPSTITEFIHQQTSIVSQSYVFASSSKESYARGAIVLSTHKDLQVLCKFFNNPGHIIISSRGRPWVVARNILWRDISAPTGTCMLKSQKKLQNGNAGISHELKLAYSGTEEFKKAKLLRDLHAEFTFHLERLHKRLATEEKKILQPSPASV